MPSPADDTSTASKPLSPCAGRFAPSPTGPLHFGSLLAATASYLEARRLGGRWYLRIDDIDPPREMPGAREAIPRTLEAFGFAWDGPIQYQSQRLSRYRAALEQLIRDGMAYPCACTRRQVRQRAREGVDGPVYPGTCREGLPPGREGRAIRMRCADARVHFDDGLQGPIDTDMDRDMGDFVIRRADGLMAYHLAAAVDDGETGISHVVRGMDLLYSTPRQIHLMQALGLSIPRYSHIPVAVNAEGQKLSKQTGATAINPDDAGAELFRALQHLHQDPPATLATADTASIWSWASRHWRPERLRGITETRG